MMTIKSLSVTQSNTKIIHRFWQLLQLLQLNIVLYENKVFQMDLTVVTVCVCARAHAHAQVSDVARTK
jgi:hypothetical protein